jgi:hypothetical protein
MTMVTCSPPEVGVTAVIRLVLVPVALPVAKVWSYTQVLPTAAGKMAEALATPLLEVPEVGDALAVAFPDAAELELLEVDVVPEPALECDPQPATAKAAVATAAPRTAGLHAMKLDRFIVRTSAQEFVVMFAARECGSCGEGCCMFCEPRGDARDPRGTRW